MQLHRLIAKTCDLPTQRVLSHGKPMCDARQSQEHKLLTSNHLFHFLYN
jgi:hypothetical protein